MMNEYVPQETEIVSKATSPQYVGFDTFVDKEVTTEVTQEAESEADQEAAILAATTAQNPKEKGIQNIIALMQRVGHDLPPLDTFRLLQTSEGPPFHLSNRQARRKFHGDKAHNFSRRHFYGRGFKREQKIDLIGDNREEKPQSKVDVEKLLEKGIAV